MVDCMSAHNYIMNNRSLHFTKYDLKGIVMFPVVLHELRNAKEVQSYLSYLPLHLTAKYGGP